MEVSTVRTKIAGTRRTRMGPRGGEIPRCRRASNVKGRGKEDQKKAAQFTQIDEILYKRAFSTLY